MISLLIAIGRFVIIVSAVLVVIGSGIAGWNIPNQPAPMPYGFAPFEPIRIASTVLGIIGGLIASGSILGLAAAIFDIQRRVAAAVPVIHPRDPARR